MKTILASIITVLLTGCANLTPTENVLLGVAAGAVIVDSMQPRTVIYTDRYYRHQPVHRHRHYHRR